MDEVSFGIIPIRKSDKAILLIQSIEGTWSFPKGHAMEGETPIETARRELKEETSITNIELISEVSFSEEYEFNKGSNTVKKTNVFFLGFTSDANFVLQKEELQSAKWLPYSEALSRLTFKESKKILEDAFSYLETRSDMIHL